LEFKEGLDGDDPRLEHSADSIRMADDVSKQDNSGIGAGNLPPDAEMATVAAWARTAKA